MKNALISSKEPVLNGFRVAEVSSQTFEVNPALFWVECQDNIQADKYYYILDTGLFELVPVPEILSSATASSGSIPTQVL